MKPTVIPRGTKRAPTTMTTSELANISTNTSVFFVHLISARRVHVKSIFQYGGKCSITAALTWGQKLERLKSIMLYHCAYSKSELISARHTCIDRSVQETVGCDHCCIWQTLEASVFDVCINRLEWNSASPILCEQAGVTTAAWTTAAM
jgi:hypothetical protein